MAYIYAGWQFFGQYTLQYLPHLCLLIFCKMNAKFIALLCVVLFVVNAEATFPLFGSSGGNSNGNNNNQQQPFQPLFQALGNHATRVSRAFNELLGNNDSNSNSNGGNSGSNQRPSNNNNNNNGNK
ncbi:unnamed protein product [Chrysodeixis includens]|uniref:Uncharacterized protein n=1 Tax=Chrysodeixis includens TaxID=689277 RepID=A0A9P0BQV4_CHRIL|nr:unnamed protein product [Chrysodeixis includens]